jgi:hypothetical protein
LHIESWHVWHNQCDQFFIIADKAYLLLFHGKIYVFILTKKWLGLHFGRCFQKLFSHHLAVDAKQIYHNFADQKSKGAEIKPKLFGKSI